MKTSHSLELVSPEGSSRCELQHTTKPPWRLLFMHKTLGNLLCESSDLFDALCKLRLVLERHNYKILCNGGRIDAWPSNMARDMGGGKKVYITQIGKRAQFDDLVPLFGPTEGVLVATVQVQIAHHREWIRSIMSELNTPPPEALKEAKLRPNGWVYKIEGDYGPQDSVPVEAIVGAWKVDFEGNIVGDFVPNPKYKPRQ